MTDIPVSDVTRRVQFTSNATTGPFAFTFEVLDQEDIAVYKNRTLLTLTTDYTVTVNANGTGSVTLVSALLITDVLTIIGDRPLARTSDFSSGGDLRAATLNEELDSLTIMSQQLNEAFDRTIRLHPGDLNRTMTLPSATDRAGGFLSFDSSGNVAINAVANLDFLDLERLDIDNIRIDGNTVSSLAGNITLDSLGDITLDHASLGSIYFSRAGTAFGEIYGRNATSELRLYGDDSGTLITLTAEHVSASSTIARLKTDNAALYLDTDSGGLIYLQANSDVIKLDVATANNLKISTDASNEVFILNNSGLTIDGSITSTYGYFTDIYSSSLRTSVGVDWLSRGADYVQFKSGASSSDYAQINFDNVASDIIKLKSFNGNDLHLDAENVVSLLYNGGVKLSTKTDGVTVTGDVGATTGTFTGDVSAANATLTGYLRGPATFTIDPATHGDNTGTVVIAGDLQVDGTTTTINSTTLTVDDANIVVASGAANAAAADGAGLTIDGANITFTYDDSDGRMELNKELFVYGNSTNGEASFVSISNSDTGGDDVRIQGTNPTYTNYDTTIPTSGVSEYIGGHNFLGRLTSSSFHTYGAIRPYIVEGLDSNTTGKKGGLHFGVSDGSSSAVTNIILKVEPDGIDVTGDITVSGTVDGRDLATDGTKLDGIEAGADVTDATNVQAAGALMDSELTDITAVKAINQGLATTDNVTFNNVDVDGDLTIGSSTFTWDSGTGQDGQLQLDRELFVYGNVTNGTAAYVQIGSSDTGGDDIRIQGTNPNFTLYDTTVPTSGVSTYIGGWYNYGRLTSSSYIAYSAIRPYIVEGLDSDSTGKKGGLHFGVRDGASSALTNIIMKVEPDGVDVTGTVTADGLTVDGGTVYHKLISTFPATYTTNLQVGQQVNISNNAVTDTLSIENTGTAAQTNIQFSTAGSEAMRIDGSGRVGIGTTSPNNMLTLENGDLQIHETGSSDPLVQLSVGGTQASPTQSWVLRVDNSDSDKFQLLDQTDTRVVLTADGDGKVGIGTSSPAGKLQVYTSANRFQSLTGASADLEIVSDNNTNPVALIKGTGTADLLNVFDNTTEVFTILDGGRVGIGTSSPSAQLEVKGTSYSLIRVNGSNAHDAGIDFGDADDADIGRIRYDNSNNAMKFTVNAAERMRISSLGRVGIGTSDPQSDLQISSSSSPVLKLTGGSTGTPQIHFGDLDSDIGMIEYKNSNDSMVFTTAGSGRVTIDSSGNLLVGKTSASSSTAGFQASQDGQTAINRSGTALQVGRLSTDGSIIELRKDGSPVGSIGVDDGTLKVTHSDSAGRTLEIKGPNSSDNGYIGTTSNHPLVFVTNGATNEAMRIDSSGNVGIGTSSIAAKLHIESASGSITPSVHADELLVEGSGNSGITIGSGISSQGSIRFADSGGDSRGQVNYDHSADSLRFYTADSLAATIDSNGNLLFGQNAVIGQNTSDGSDNRGVFLCGGASQTVSRGGSVRVYGNEEANTGDVQIYSGNASNSNITINAYGSNSTIQFTTNGGAEAMRIDSSGNVGIGTSNPQLGSAWNKVLHIHSSSGTGSHIRFTDPTSGETGESGLYIGQYGVDSYIINRESGKMLFVNNGSEAMRIDSNQNLLVGHTGSVYNNVNATSTEGISLTENGEIFACSSQSSGVMILNRKSTDGNILTLDKDGSTVGSIGTASSTTYIAGDASGIRLGSTAFMPSTAAGANKDNSVDLGHSAVRFDDIYATNGTIQTSDANEKQDIAELSDAEQRVAVAAKGLLRKFRWKDAVAEKGDEARTHFGIIAQDLQAAFAAEGLDAGDYAMFIDTTWTDEETGEERSRMGVRYSELLAFIIAAI